MENDWRFKGGVIDGYPRTVEAAEAIWGNEELISFPSKIIFLDAPDDWIREKLKKIGGHEGTHFNDEGNARRLPIFRKLC